MTAAAPKQVFGADEQDAVAVDVLRFVHLAQLVLDAERVPREAEVSLIFVDEQSITDLNERFLGVGAPTDVLAFPLDDDVVPGGRFPDEGGRGPGASPEPTDLPIVLGDVVICPAVAARNVAGQGGAVDDELSLLVVHGVLHLLDYDHAEPAETARMQSRERELLARFAALEAEPEDAVVTGTDWLILGAVVVLFLFSIFLALAETAFVRMGRIRAVALAEDGRKHAAKLVTLIEHPEQTLNSVLLLVLVAQLTSATLLGILLEGLAGTLGVVLGIVLQIVIFFALGEVAPKTYAVQHTDRAALLSTPFLYAITVFPPMRFLSRSLIGLANVILPGARTEAGAVRHRGRRARDGGRGRGRRRDRERGTSPHPLDLRVR